jgi:hypothetical protein
MPSRTKAPLLSYLLKIYPMKHASLWLVASICGALAFSGCNASRVVSPLEEGEWRIGGAVGGPTVNTSRLPLMSVYAAHGHSAKQTRYTGLALTSLGFQSLQVDAGALHQLIPGAGWSPEINANLGGNLLVSFRDGAPRVYPHVGLQSVWHYKKLLPYVGTENWIDPTYGLVDGGKGSLIHPSLHTGLRYVGKWFEFGIEGKWLNPTRTFVIPQQTVPTFLGTGAYGLYYTLAFRLP